MPRSITVPPPDLQIGFAEALSRIRKEHLQDALLATVREMEVPAIDEELARFVARADLAILASHGLRGELLFAVPCILRKTPKLLTYYRLMLGYSQKEFYSAKHVGTRFKKMEDGGDTTEIDDDSLTDLCRGFISAASLLLAAIDKADLSSSFLDDLSLLTLGAQLRGGLNVKKGADAIKTVFSLIHGLVAEFAVKTSKWGIHVRNAAGRESAYRVCCGSRYRDLRGNATRRATKYHCHRSERWQGLLECPQSNGRSGKEPPKGSSKGLRRVLDGC